MNQTRKAWTRKWHAILDRELGADANAEPESRFTEPDCDFRMHFDTWQLSDAALRECFSMLPMGDVLAGRLLDKQAWATNVIISENEAISMLHQAIRDVSSFAKLSHSTEDKIRVLRGNQAELEALQARDAIPYEVITEDIWEPLFETIPDELKEAFYFISETLYKRTSLYEGVYHTLWPYVDPPAGIDPFANLLRMRRSEIKWLADNNGLLIFYNDDEPINDTANTTLHLDGHGLQEVSHQFIAGLEACIAHHVQRGFSVKRLTQFDIGLGSCEPFRFVIRPLSTPEIADEDELAYTGWIKVKDARLVIKEGYGLFFDGQKKGEHTENISFSVHVKRGKDNAT